MPGPVYSRRGGRRRCRGPARTTNRKQMSEETKHVFKFSVAGRAYIRAESENEAKKLLNEALAAVVEYDEHILQDLSAVPETPPKEN